MFSSPLVLHLYVWCFENIILSMWNVSTIISLPHFFSNWATSALSIEIYKREHREAVADHSLKSSSLDHRLHYTSCNFILLMFDSIRNISSEACCSSWSVWSSLSLLQCLKKCRKILDFFGPPPFSFFLLFLCVCVSVTVISPWLFKAFLLQEMAVSMHCSNGYAWLL